MLFRSFLLFQTLFVVLATSSDPVNLTGTSSSDLPDDLAVSLAELVLEATTASPTAIEAYSRRESESSRELRSSSPLTVVNDCGFDITWFTLRYNVDESTASAQAAPASGWQYLQSGSSFLINGVSGDYVHYAGVSYDGTTFDQILSGSAWSSNFYVFTDPFVKTYIGTSSQLRLCSSTNSAPTLPPTPAPVPSPGSGGASASCPSSTPNCGAWLTAHNTRRMQYHQRENRSPVTLSWDNQLASEAQQWANTFASGPSCTYAHDPSTSDGENLSLNGGTGSYATSRTPEQILTAWWDEEEELTRQSSFNIRDILHFTQAAWYGTQHIGCGEIEKDVMFGNTAGKCFVQVCRYRVRGNCNINNGNWENAIMYGNSC